MKYKIVISTMLLVLVLAGCASKPAENQSLRIAVLPVLDTLPLYVAEAQGYYEDYGLDVEFVLVNSAPERDQLMQTGQVDGMLNELVSTILFNQQGTRVQIVRFARAATETYPLFRLLSAPDSGIELPADLKNIPIAISDGTVIEYTTDRMLENAGFNEVEIASISVPKIPDRMALLISGEILAANLPDPVASVAIMNGCHLVVDDTSFPQISFSVYSFSVQAMEEKSEAIKDFLAAIEKATIDINVEKTGWNDLLLERKLIPEVILDTYTLPDYPLAGVPTLEQFEDALDWLLQKQLVENVLDYNDHINPAFLPE